MPIITIPMLISSLKGRRQESNSIDFNGLDNCDTCVSTEEISEMNTLSASPAYRRRKSLRLDTRLAII